MNLHTSVGAGRAALLVAAAISSGCAHWQPVDNLGITGTGCDRGLSPADNTRLATIEQMVSEGKVYAAIAELDGLALNAPKAQLMRANALRHTEMSDQARPIFTALLDTCYAGQAHHGLGLALMRDSLSDTGLAHLKAAREALPTQPDIRNDYGYALFLMGHLEEAQFELLTALDLDPKNSRAIRNAVRLLFKRGAPERAQAFGRKFGLDQTTMDKLRTTASESEPAPLNLAPIVPKTPKLP
jgi:Flp pilus assembly protein TadD